MPIKLYFAMLTCGLFTSTSATLNHKNAESVNSDRDISGSKCIDDCFLLYDTIISELNKTVKPCDNMYAVMCNDNKKYLPMEYPNNILPTIQSHTISILNSPIKTSNELKFFSIDKQLYQQCMNLGSERQNEEYLAYEILRRQLIKYVKENRKWQDFEMTINSLGFAYTFFEISVINDPEDPSHRIIILQPPSFKHLQTITNKISNILSHRYHYGKIKYLDKSGAFDDLFDFVDEYLKEYVLAFLDSFSGIESIVLQKYKNSQLLNVKTTIEDFNNFFAQLSEINDFEEIDWTMIIRKTFQNVNIQVTGKENIIIRNKPYFIELTRLLRRTPNKVLVSAILTKLITENLAYIDWDVAQSLEILNKRSFCLKETKLYGVSHKIIYNYIADKNDIYLLRRVEDIVTNIVDIVSNQILKSYSILSREQLYLEHKLKLITDHLFDYIFYSPFNPHADFDLTPSYFFNIVKYREILKHQELKTLRDTSYLQLPFSIMEAEKAQNRFILFVLTNSGVLLSPTLPKGFLYGNFGVKIASFLYALMNENTFKGGTYYDNKLDWFAHPEYSEDAISCFRSSGMVDYNSNEATYMITETFGLQIAYRAMIKDDYIASFNPISLNLLQSNKITMEKLFFLTYVKNHCYADSDIVNHILSTSEIFSNTFKCYNDKYLNKCQLQTFGTEFEKMYLTQLLKRF